MILNVSNHITLGVKITDPVKFQRGFNKGLSMPMLPLFVFQKSYAREDKICLRNALSF